MKRGGDILDEFCERSVVGTIVDLGTTTLRNYRTINYCYREYAVKEDRYLPTRIQELLCRVNCFAVADAITECCGASAGVLVAGNGAELAEFVCAIES